MWGISSQSACCFERYGGREIKDSSERSEHKAESQRLNSERWWACLIRHRLHHVYYKNSRNQRVWVGLVYIVMDYPWSLHIFLQWPEESTVFVFFFFVALALAPLVWCVFVVKNSNRLVLLFHSASCSFSPLLLSWFERKSAKSLKCDMILRPSLLLENFDRKCVEKKKKKKKVEKKKKKKVKKKIILNKFCLYGYLNIWWHIMAFSLCI